ncbi:MAG: FAD-dependent oxidoreductase [Myxococcota bacterium]|nr:FAD-dependent oxidoreductase [Myxococcota bacterium]
MEQDNPKMNRRSFVLSSLALPACQSTTGPREGSFWGPQIGHFSLYQGNRNGHVQKEVDVLIVGAGISGLSAAWRLARENPALRVEVLELAPFPGGTSASLQGDLGSYPLGAHYITIPSKEAFYMRQMLSDMGLCSLQKDKPPIYNPLNLCLAPEERVYAHERWQLGLWPQFGVLPEETKQYRAFREYCAQLKSTIGIDNKPVFSIPIAYSSQDPQYQRWKTISFYDWLLEEGYTTPKLHWWLEYATKDDYGTALQGCSAWAGLHYFCARRPYIAQSVDLGTHILTWESGNGALVQKLLQLMPWKIRYNAIVQSVDAQSGHVFFIEGKEQKTIRADHIILAIPSAVRANLLEQSWENLPQASPWIVAQIACKELPQSKSGCPYAWDNVLYGSESVGYIVNTHQRGNYGGPSTLSWYLPFYDVDLVKARKQAAKEDWWSIEDRILSEFSLSHRNATEAISRIDVNVWGHGTVRPEVGLHATPLLKNLQAPVSRVHFAHCDLSGISLFEESAWHGVRAAEAVLSQSNDNITSLL